MDAGKPSEHFNDIYNNIGIKINENNLKINGDNAENPVIMNIPTKEMMLKLNENNLKNKFDICLKHRYNESSNNETTNQRKHIMNNIDRLEMIRIAVEKQYAKDNK